MQETGVFISPLADGGVWRGALLWAIALYIPLSAPLAAFETSLAAICIGWSLLLVAFNRED